MSHAARFIACDDRSSRRRLDGAQSRIAVQRSGILPALRAHVEDGRGVHLRPGSVTGPRLQQARTSSPRWRRHSVHSSDCSASTAPKMHDRVPVAEDGDGVGAAADLLVQPLRRVVGPDRGPYVLRETDECEDARARGVQVLGHRGQPDAPSLAVLRGRASAKTEVNVPAWSRGAAPGRIDLLVHVGGHPRDRQLAQRGPRRAGQQGRRRQVRSSWFSVRARCGRFARRPENHG